MSTRLTASLKDNKLALPGCLEQRMALLAGAYAAVSLPGLGWEPLACIAWTPLLGWVVASQRTGRLRWGMLVLAWAVWYGVGQSWLLQLHPLDWLGLPAAMSMGLALLAWGINTATWAIAWSLPFVLANWCQRRLGGNTATLLGWAGLWLALLWPLYAIKSGWAVFWLYPSLSVGLWPAGWWTGLGYWGPLGSTLALLAVNAALLPLWQRWGWRLWIPVTVGLIFISGVGSVPVPSPTGGKTDLQALLSSFGRRAEPLTASSSFALPTLKEAKPGTPVLGVWQPQLPVAQLEGTLTERLVARRQLWQAVIQHLPAPGSLLVLPEEGAFTRPVAMVPGVGYLSPQLAQWQRLAQQSGVGLVLGASVVFPATATQPTTQWENQLLLLLPNGQVWGSGKRWLVPFGEQMPVPALLWQTWRQWSGWRYDTVFRVPNQQPTVWPTPWGRLGLVNCVEVADSNLARQYARLGATWLVGSANLGWFHNSSLLQRQFEAHARLRALETELPIALSANTGNSLIWQPKQGIGLRLGPQIRGLLTVPLQPHD